MTQLRPHKIRRSWFGNSSGMGIIQVLFFSGILLLIISTLSRNLRNVSFFQAKASRLDSWKGLAARTERLSTDPMAMGNAAELASCLGNAGLCTDTQNTWKSLSLPDPFSTDKTLLEGIWSQNGTRQVKDGTSCGKTLSLDCPFKIETTYVLKCTDAMTTCSPDKALMQVAWRLTVHADFAKSLPTTVNMGGSEWAVVLAGQESKSANNGWHVAKALGASGGDTWMRADAYRGARDEKLITACPTGLMPMNFHFDGAGNIAFDCKAEPDADPRMAWVDPNGNPQTVPTWSTPCPYGQSMRKVTVGEKDSWQCVPFGGTCPRGQLSVGFDSSGQAKCDSAGPKPTPIPADCTCYVVFAAKLSQTCNPTDPKAPADCGLLFGKCTSLSSSKASGIYTTPAEAQALCDQNLTDNVGLGRLVTNSKYTCTFFPKGDTTKAGNVLVKTADAMPAALPECRF